jgi:hypothetical protein
VPAVRRQVFVTLLVLAATALVAGLYFAFRPSSETAPAPATTGQATEPPEVEPVTTAETTTEQTTTPTAPDVKTLRVTLRDGRPAGGIQHLSVRQGDRVQVRVASDVRDHVHVHGYDLMRDVAPGSPATIQFRATLTGRFEVELEDRGIPIAELEVRP